jgi:hypothetical protein
MRGIGPILRSHFLFFPLSLAAWMRRRIVHPKAVSCGARFVRQEFRRNPRNVTNVAQRQVIQTGIE